jgi:BlaI family transcriptional regulator, penicillinase repressor
MSSYFCYVSNKITPEPTKAELEILEVLWKHGPSTARFINDDLNAGKREVIYMSTLKIMQIMVEKGLLEKEGGQYRHVYRAVVEEKTTRRHLLDKIVENVFGGSTGSLMMHLLDDKKISPKDMELYKELIKKIDDK